jgi:hypothetical protein
VAGDNFPVSAPGDGRCDPDAILSNAYTEVSTLPVSAPHLLSRRVTARDAKVDQLAFTDDR